jgi:hypothetical protein
VLNFAAPEPNTADMFVNIFRPDAIGTRSKSREEPVNQEISEQKLVASHVPKQNWLPFFNGEAALSQSHKCPIAIAWVESSVQDKNKIPQPSSGIGTDETSRLRRSRFSFLVDPKSQAANTAYVSSIIAPLMAVNDEAM